MRQKKYGEDAEEYCNGSFNEEDERPSFVILGVDFGKTCSEKSTECTRPIKLAQLYKSCLYCRYHVLTMGLHNRRGQF
jgi:N-formylglutamate amidohydrolase